MLHCAVRIWVYCSRTIWGSAREVLVPFQNCPVFPQFFLIFSLVNLSAYDIPPTININNSLLRTFPRTGSRNPCYLRCFFPVFPKTPGRPPSIQCCIWCLWSNCGKRCLDRVSKPQKRAARIIRGADSHAPSVHFFNKLKRIPFFANAKLAKFCIIYKRWQGRVPSYLTSLLAVTGETRSR